MNAPAKLIGFAVVLAALIAGGAALGGVIDPDRSKSETMAAHGGEPAEPATHGAESAEPETHGARPAEPGAHAAKPVKPETHGAKPAKPAAHGGGSAEHPVRGVAVAENGLQLVVEDPERARGRTEKVRFRVVGKRGATVSDFDRAHTKRMHLIVARRDMTGFQHLHPKQAADGSWSVPLRLAEPGSYRLFADFERAGEKHTLATDLRVDGPASLEPFPAPAGTAVSDGGYEVSLEGAAAAPGEEAHLDFTVTKDGRERQTEPYLGAGGHLVALREGDMAFLHVHPTEGHGATGISFGATFPTLGRYRLFLQFKIDGKIQTVAFTQEVK